MRGFKVSASYTNANAALTPGSEKCKHRFTTATSPSPIITSCTDAQQNSPEIGSATTSRAVTHAVAISRPRPWTGRDRAAYGKMTSGGSLAAYIEAHECAMCRQERTSKTRVASGPEDPRFSHDKFLNAPTFSLHLVTLVDSFFDAD